MKLLSLRSCVALLSLCVLLLNLGPNQLMLVLASGKNCAQAVRDLPTNFKLSSSGGHLALVDRNGSI